MTKYIEDTLQAIDLKIAFLQRPRKSLAELFKDWTIEADPEPQPGLGCFAKLSSAKPAPRKAAKNGAAKRNFMAERANSARIVALLRDMPEPIKPKAVAALGQINHKNTGNYLHRLKAKGWLRMVGYGQYARTAKFPGVASPKTAPQPVPAARVHVPALDGEDKGSIEQQLEKALKDRDAALAGGQERLASILQDKVDKLMAKQLHLNR